MVRVGLVLGAGGVTGEAFHRGLLRALRDATGWQARAADVVVGTSAGALLAAALRAPAAEPPEVVARADGGGPDVRAWPDLAGLANGLRRPWRTRVGALASAALPAGRMSTEFVVAGLRARHGLHWPPRRTWLVAVRRRDGRRVAFGRPGEPATDVATAVAASCAVPAYFRPVVVDGEEYVDGGVHSPTNADLLRHEQLDLVVVSSPMSARPVGLRPKLDLPARVMWHAYATREVGKLRAAGARTLLVEPGGDLLAAMGLHPLRAHRVDEVEELSYRSVTRLLDKDTSAMPRRVLQRSATAHERQPA